MQVMRDLAGQAASAALSARPTAAAHNPVHLIPSSARVFSHHKQAPSIRLDHVQLGLGQAFPRGELKVSPRYARQPIGLCSIIVDQIAAETLAR
jgi:hypothetical protein